jgi:hypothetical protein
MASSFKFYTDSGLTNVYGGITSTVHNTSLSDNPQNFLLYFGSALTINTTKLQAVSSPGVAQIVLAPTLIAGIWKVATVFATGAIITPSTPNGYVYIATVGGTSHASTEPTWPVTVGSTVIDNSSITWTCYAVQHAVTEIKLALAGGSTLSSATAGASLNLGTVINSGVANAVPVYFSLSNATTTINNDTGYPEIGININQVQEVAY